MRHDVIVVGGGIVGSAIALALAKFTSLTILVIDSATTFPSWDETKYQSRVSAISPASQRFFQSLGVWDKIIAKRVSPYLKMHVWEDTGAIYFDHNEVWEPILGSIIEDAVIRESLHQTFTDSPAITFLHPIQLKSIIKQDKNIILYTEDQKEFSAGLLIAADGAHSWVRNALGISINEYAYDHTAIVTTVKTENPHEKTAYQRFLPTGPLAFLPLDDPHYCSIVWSTLPAHAEHLMALSEKDFGEVLSEVFEYKLGKVVEVQKRHSFSLHKRHVDHYVEDGIALLGDAAHTLHPLAGQGMNLGLLDAAALSEIVTSALTKHREYASLATLRRYERWRKSENQIMIACVGMLKQLFAQESRTIKAFRNTGLNVVNHLTLIKRRLIQHALGNK